jgi:hypothetical protein
MIPATSSRATDWMQQQLQKKHHSWADESLKCGLEGEWVGQ